jgi:carboxypeptidase PM20D1
VIKRAILFVVVLLVLLAAVMFFNASTMESRQPPMQEPVSIELDMQPIVERFSAALTYPTISNQDRSDVDTEAFVGFHAFLERSYPLVHATLERETVNDLSLLYRWQGSDRALPPVLLMGHMDVVPVIPGTEEDWQQPPFSGAVVDGEIWGRGALDDKSSVMAIMEAVEHLLARGFQPRRTVWLAFGHDEEVGGPEGAGAIAEVLASRGVADFAFVLDEGGAIVDGEAMGLDGSVAVIGVAEKGFISLELSVEGDGGHSSTPPEHTTIGILSAAITRLENNQFPARLDGAVEEMFSYTAPEMGLGARLALGNLWLTRPLVVRMLLGSPQTASMVRTTTAVTMMNAGVKDNVLPIDATAVVNHRILPGETRESVMARVREVIDDGRIQVRDISSSQNPSPVSDPESAAFALIAKTLRQIDPDPDLYITPYLVMGGTDAKYYSGRSDNVFRFLPIRIGPEGLRLAHGTNERIQVDALAAGVRYMMQLVRNTDEL